MSQEEKQKKPWYRLYLLVGSFDPKRNDSEIRFVADELDIPTEEKTVGQIKTDTLKHILQEGLKKEPPLPVPASLVKLVEVPEAAPEAAQPPVTPNVTDRSPSNRDTVPHQAPIQEDPIMTDEAETWLEETPEPEAEEATIPLSAVEGKIAELKAQMDAIEDKSKKSVQGLQRLITNLPQQSPEAVNQDAIRAAVEDVVGPLFGEIDSLKAQLETVQNVQEHPVAWSRPHINVPIVVITAFAALLFGVIATYVARNYQWGTADVLLFVLVGALYAVFFGSRAEGSRQPSDQERRPLRSSERLQTRTGNSRLRNR